MNLLSSPWTWPYCLVWHTQDNTKGLHNRIQRTKNLGRHKRDKWKSHSCTYFLQNPQIPTSSINTSGLSKVESAVPNRVKRNDWVLCRNYLSQFPLRLGRECSYPLGPQSHAFFCLRLFWSDLENLAMHQNKFDDLG